MSFGRQLGDQPPTSADVTPVKPRKRSQVNWLRGGIMIILFGAANLIYISQTGKSLMTRAGTKADIAFDVVLSIGTLIFGAIALAIHLYKSRN